MPTQQASYTAVIQFDAESGLYIGSIPAINGCHTQGATLSELRANLREALVLCLEVMEERGELPLPADPEVIVERIELSA